MTIIIGLSSHNPERVAPLNYASGISGLSGSYLFWLGVVPMFNNYQKKIC